MMLWRCAFWYNQKTYRHNIPLKWLLLHTHTSRRFAHQGPPRLAKPPTTRSFVLSLNTSKRSREGIKIGIGLWSYSKLFFFCLCNSKVILYSNGLHVPEGGGPLHYTIFGFCELGGTLKQRWAMHIDEDGTSSCVFSKKRRISWEDIIPLSVCEFLTASLFFILFYFIQGLTCCAPRICLTSQPEKVGEIVLYLLK